MAIKKVPVGIISASFLADHLKSHHGLDVRANMGVGAMQQRMRDAGLDPEWIEYDDGLEEESVLPAQAQYPAFKRHVEGQRWAKIRIEEQDKPGGSEKVFVSVNGVHLLIPRAQDCWVKFHYLEALRNAVAHIPIDDTGTRFRKVPEYPTIELIVEPPLTAAERRIEAERDAKAAEEKAARMRQQLEEADAA